MKESNQEEDKPKMKNPLLSFSGNLTKNNSLLSFKPSEIISNSVCNIYPEGMTSLISEPHPPKGEPHIIIILNCPSTFHRQYAPIIKQPDSFNNFGIVGLISVDGPHVDKENITKEKFDALNDQEKIDYTSEKAQNTTLYEHMASELFENFDSYSESLLKSIFAKIAEAKSKQLQKENWDLYNNMFDIYKKFVVKVAECPPEFYYYFTYEDFILIICRILKYYLNLNISISLPDVNTMVKLCIYGSNEQIGKLAQDNEYELKLRPYALKYQYYLDALEDKTKLSGANLVGESGSDPKEEDLIEKPSSSEMKKGWRALKYEEWLVNKPLHWPPYIEYEVGKDIKFQKYNKDDTYHECSNNPLSEELCGNCSTFRNIDKLRIIYDSIDKMVKFNYMKKEKILNDIIIQRNDVAYKDTLSIKNIIFKSWNIFSRERQQEFIFIVRNFYGEIFSYYFLWWLSYIRWLLFPAVWGSIVYIARNILPKEPNGASTITHEIFILAFCAIVIIWAMLFLNHWKEKELLFNYFWGTRNFKHWEPDSESFVPDGKKEWIFNVKFPYVNKFKRYMKLSFSFLILFLMAASTCGLVIFLFFWKYQLTKDHNQEENDWFTLEVSMGIASLNAVQIKIMNFLYGKIARALNNWENHQKDYQKTNSLAVKVIMFEFVNCYCSLFYIVFIKSVFGDKCIGYSTTINDKGEIINKESCLEEVELQLYTTFMINLGFNLMEIGLPIWNQYLKFRKYRQASQQNPSNVSVGDSVNISSPAHSISIKEIIPHTLEHQMLCDPYDDIISEYSEMLILFGYVTLFSVAAPLTPVIIFGLVYLEKYVDSFKLFFLHRVNLLDQSNGIEIYKKIIEMFIYLGMVTNVSFIIFGDPDFNPGDNSIKTKIIIFCVVEIILFIVSSFAKWTVIPMWFEFVNEIQEWYIKKYYSRDDKDIPHYLLVEKINFKNSGTIKVKSE